MADWVITYLIIGSVFMFIMDMLLIRAENKFTNFERIIGILFWPIGLGSFIYNFIKERNKDEE